jgi:general secretion pathway protein N
MMRSLAIILWAASAHAALSAVPNQAADALDAGLLDDARPGGPVLTPPPASEPVTSVRLAPSQSPAPRPLIANPLWGIPLKALAHTRDRPVFSPSRRPPPVAVAEPEDSKPPPPPPPRKAEIVPPPLSLVGTIAGGDEGFGIFLDQSTKAALRLKIGDDYQGWKLRAINGREVTLEKDQQGALLTLPAPGSEDSGNVRLLPISTERRPLAARH